MKTLSSNWTIPSQTTLRMLFDLKAKNVSFSVLILLYIQQNKNLTGLLICSYNRKKIYITTIMVDSVQELGNDKRENHRNQREGRLRRRK